MKLLTQKIESRKEHFDMWQFLEWYSGLSLFGAGVVFGRGRVWYMPKPKKAAFLLIVSYIISMWSPNA